MARHIENIEALKALVGEHIGHSDYLTVTQEHVNQFADATGDHQWIHVDPERAKAGPFGTTIAHGFLTLSLLPQFFAKAFKVLDQKMGINYGVNKVRFTAPVLVGSRLRAKMTLKSCDPIENNGMQLVWSVIVEREGGDKPVCVAETVTRLYA